jgi:hypothetical protein
MDEPEGKVEELAFTADDITVNREGRLSEAQRSHLRREARVWSVVFGGSFVLWLICLIMSVGWGAPIGPLKFVSPVFFGLFLLGNVFLLWFWIRPKWVDVGTGIVLSATGSAELRSVSRRGEQRYHMKIGTLDMDVSLDMYKLLCEGRSYEVFYTPASKTILGIVRLDESGAPELN